MTTKGPFLLGLTGSIGMGKSTTAGYFREFGVPVWDADEAVHRLYAPDGAAVKGIRALYPDAISENSVDRTILRKWIAHNDTAILQLEKLVHPLVAEDRKDFIKICKDEGRWLVVLDIPLLFETGGDKNVNATLVVTINYDEQKRRVLERKTMTLDQFEKIRQKQMPDAEKRAKADFVIETASPKKAKGAVKTLLEELKQNHENA